MKEKYHYFTNQNGEEAIQVYDWNKNHQLKIFINTSLGYIKVCKMVYSKKGDIYFYPQIQAKEYLCIDNKSKTKTFVKDFENHKHFSFHASGIVKGPDYKTKTNGYANFDFRIDNLDKPREIFEQLPTIPNFYKTYNEKKDKKKSRNYFINSPNEISKCTPRLVYSIVDSEHFKSSKIFTWEKKYLVAFNMMNFEKESSIILLISLSFIEANIPQNEVIIIKC